MCTAAHQGRVAAAGTDSALKVGNDLVELSYSSLLKTHRLAAGLSLRALAARAGIGHTLLVRSETGSRPPASPREVLALAAGLGLAPADRDALLGAAGFWPGAFLALGPADPTLLAVVRLLTPETASPEEIAAFRATVDALVRLGPADSTLLAFVELLTQRTISIEGINAFREAVDALIRCVVAASHPLGAGKNGGDDHSRADNASYATGRRATELTRAGGKG